MMVVLVIAGLGVLALVHECGHALAAWAARMHITDFSVGLGPSWARRRWRGAVVRFGIIPFGGFVRVTELAPEASTPRDYGWRAVGARLAVIGAGPASNYLVAALLGIAIAASWGIPTGRIVGLEVTAVGDHARSAGLRPGDVLVEVNDQAVSEVPELATTLRAAGRTGSDAELVVRRAGATMRLSARPLERQGRWGLGARYVARPELRAAGSVQAAAHGLALPVRVAGTLLRNGAQMLVPDSGVHPLSPVGLADRVARSGRWDGRRALGFAALLSVVVGLFNLLPVPGLDGGRLCIEVAEAALRRRLGRRLAVGIQLAGALVLLTLWLVVVVRDVAGWAR